MDSEYTISHGMKVGDTLRVGFTCEVPLPEMTMTALVDGVPHEFPISKPYVAPTTLYVTHVDYEKRIITLDSTPPEVKA